LRERIAAIKQSHDGVVQAIDCVSGQVAGTCRVSAAPHGELVFYVCAVRRAPPNTIPNNSPFPGFRALDLIYETNRFGGLAVAAWIHRRTRRIVAAAIDRNFSSPKAAPLRVPEGQPTPSKSQRARLFGRSSRTRGQTAAGVRSVAEDMSTNPSHVVAQFVNDL